MASFGIGAKLRQERVGKGLGIADIARDTRIPPRFLEAIEIDDYSSLPGLVFTRNFVRQYAMSLQLDPDPLLAELPKQDESTALLPTPPRPRLGYSSYYGDRQIRTILYSIAWVVLAACSGGGAYLYFKHLPRAAAPGASAAVTPAAATPPVAAPPVATPETPNTPTPPTGAAPVQVSLTAREAAWIQVSADGKTAFIGTLHPNETKEISATEEVKVLTGNAGALTISLNGKTLESLGPLGQVREVRLTAEGSQLVSKAPPPPTSAPDPL